MIILSMAHFYVHFHAHFESQKYLAVTDETNLESETFIDKTEGKVFNNQIWRKEWLTKQTQTFFRKKTKRCYVIQRSLIFVFHSVCRTQFRQHGSGTHQPVSKVSRQGWDTTWPVIRPAIVSAPGPNAASNLSHAQLHEFFSHHQNFHLPLFLHNVLCSATRYYACIFKKYSLKQHHRIHSLKYCLKELSA